MNASQSTVHSDSSYFDLHTRGTGFIQRPRQVRAKKGPPYLALDIMALTGEAGSTERVRFDCNVTGVVAERDVRFILERMEGAEPSDPTRPERGPRVQVGFTVADLRTDIFTYQNGPKQGETGVSLKVRLIRLHWLKLNGQRIKLPSELAADAESGPASQPEEKSASELPVAV